MQEGGESYDTPVTVRGPSDPSVKDYSRVLELLPFVVGEVLPKVLRDFLPTEQGFFFRHSPASR